MLKITETPHITLLIKFSFVPIVCGEQQFGQKSTPHTNAKNTPHAEAPSFWRPCYPISRATPALIRHKAAALARALQRSFQGLLYFFRELLANVLSQAGSGTLYKIKQIST